MIPFVSGLFGLKSGKVFWDLLYRIGEEREICLRHSAPQEKKKLSLKIRGHYCEMDNSLSL